MKIIQAIYGCSHCSFTSESQKEVGIHERTCELNPKSISFETDPKSIKRAKREALKEAKSIPELNTLLNTYLDTYYFGMMEKLGLFNKHKNLVCINNYRIGTTNIIRLSELEKLNIYIDIKDYPHIHKLVEEMREINKITSTYNKAFKTFATPKTKKYINSEDTMYVRLQISAISEEIDRLSLIRQGYSQDLDNMKEQYLNTLKEEYGFIDYQAKLKEITNILDGN